MAQALHVQANVDSFVRLGYPLHFVTLGEQCALGEGGYVVLSIELCIILHNTVTLHPHCHFDRSRIGREADNPALVGMTGPFNCHNNDVVA